MSTPKASFEVTHDRGAVVICMSAEGKYLYMHLMSNSLDTSELQYRLKRAEIDRNNYIRRFHESNATLEKIDAENSEMRVALAAVREVLEHGEWREPKHIQPLELREALGKFATEQPA